MTYNPIIVAVNPSYGTAEEQEFWRLFARHVADSRWQFVQIAARKIPHIPAAKTITMPARLIELVEKTGQHFVRSLNPNLPWLSEADINLLEDWEHRRWELPAYSPAVRHGIVFLAHLAELTLRDLRPAVVLTTNKLDHPLYLFRKAALYHGAQTYIIERSPFDSIWVEPDGIFRESVLWDQEEHIRAALQNGEHPRTSVPVVERMVSNPAGFRRKEASTSPIASTLEALPRPLFFLPMDNVLWTGWEQINHPQRLLDYPMFDTPEEAIERLNEIAQQHGGSLVVKKHPACRYVVEDRMPKGAVLVDGDLHTLFQAADVVLCFLTKLAFVSMAKRIPTVTLAYNPIAVADVTYHCLEESQIEQTIDAALARIDYADKHARFQAYCDWMAQHHFYAIHPTDDTHPRTPRMLVEHLIDRASTLELATASDSGAIIQSLGAFVEGKSAPALATGHLAKPAQRSGFSATDYPIAFDVWRLAHGYLQNFPPLGINVYSLMLYTTLKSQIEDLCITPVVYPDPAVDTPKYRMRLQTLFSEREMWLERPDPITFYDETTPQNVDVFHSPVNPLPLKRPGDKTVRVLTIHDCIHLKYPEYWEGKGEPQIQRTLQSVDPKRDYIVAVSEATKRDVLDLLPIAPEQVWVVHEAAKELFSYAIPDLVHERLRSLHVSPGHYILVLAQPDPRKNLVNVAKAFQMLHHHQQNAPYTMLFVVSSEDRRDRTVDLLTKANISLDYTAFLVGATDDELASLYANAALFVYASLYEGFGLPILEAMHAGCPVVASATSSLPEVGGQAVEYVDPKDPASIHDGMRHLLDNPALRQRRCILGKQQASQFTWEKAAIRTADLYHYILLHHAHEFDVSPAPPPSAAVQSPPIQTRNTMRGQLQSLPGRVLRLNRRVGQKFAGLWLGLVLSIQLGIYGLTSLPASQFIALIAWVPFVLAWYLRNRRNWRTFAPPLIADRNRMRTELNKAKAKEQDLQKQLAKSRTNATQLEQRLSTTEQRLSTTEQRLSTTEQQLSTTEQQLSTTEQQLSTTEQQLGKRDKRLAESAIQITELQQQLQERAAQNEQLRSQLVARNEHIARLRNQVSAYTEQLPELYFDSAMAIADIRQAVEAYDEWYHHFIFPGNIATPSDQKTPLVLQSLENIGLPRDATGLRVLDVGCCDGFYSFLMERRGAEVVSLDYCNVEELGFGIAKRIIGSSLVPHIDTIYNITPEKYGTFDVVLFLGVLYHLRHPLLGLDMIHRILRPGGHLFIETHMINPNHHPEGADEHNAITFFYERDAWQGDFTNYFGPNRPAVEAWLDSAGFIPTGFSVPTAGRGCFAARAVIDAVSAKYRDLEWETVAAQSS